MTDTQQSVEHLGETKGAENHDHDMIHELSNRLDAVWRYDQYISNAEGKQSLQTFWKKIKNQEMENVEELKHLIREHVKADCF